MDHAQWRFGLAAWMDFDPKPPVIMADANASLDVVKTWGDYGTVIIHTHGAAIDQGESVAICLIVGTPYTIENIFRYQLDFVTRRIGLAPTLGKIFIYPSFVRYHCKAMNNTFFYLGACHSLETSSLWDVLMGKGAKVAFGWSKKVQTSFNLEKFQELTTPMLPTDTITSPLTAKQAYDAIADKVDDDYPGVGAVFSMRTAGDEWNNFTFVAGGIINGGFETGDFTGWVTGGDYNCRNVYEANKHGGAKAASMGRWNNDYHGQDPTFEPLGYEWIYQDFVVPPQATYLKFYWWMETWDTAVWDWFDAAIKDTNGNTLISILSKAGKPGSDYGEYWTTQMADGGSGWREQTANISAYRGQTIRIYFAQRLDGYGDQQRVYIDDVTLE